MPGVYFDAFERPYGSPNGEYWIMQADNNGLSGVDDMWLVGMGTDGSTATIVMQEGDNLPWDASVPVGAYSTTDRVMEIDNNGHFALSHNSAGDTANDDYVVKYDGTWSVIAREGDAMPFPFQTETYDSSVDTVNLLSDGTVTFSPNSEGTLDSATDDFLMKGTAYIAQEGITVPGGQQSTPAPYDSFDTSDYHWDYNGNNWIAQGDTEGNTTEDDIVVLNGSVIVQEGFSLPGQVDVVDDFDLEVFMGHAGDYMVRGENNDGHDWILLNGVIIAETGDEVPGSGGTEHYDDASFSDTWFTMQVNGLGDYVLGATTDNPDSEADAVLVFNGTEVIARQGDPVDVNGNGLFDDDAYIDTFNNDDGFLTDGLMYYFTATLQDGAGASLGQAYMYILIPEPATLVLITLGVLALARRRH